jgi:hypothetical protein
MASLELNFKLEVECHGFLTKLTDPVNVKLENTT